MFCPMCGKENPGEARFCGHCGHELPRNPSPVPGPRPAPNSGRRSLLIMAVAAVVIVGVAIFGIMRCIGGGGRGTAQDLANELTKSYQRVFDEDMSDASIEAFAETTLDAMPPEVVEAALEEGSVESREEAIEQVGDSFAASLAGSESLLDKADFEIQMTVGDKLDDDYIDGVNENFEELGISIEVTEAYELGIDMKITALEDVGILEAGESRSQEVSNSGTAAVKIGNSWYLWINGLNW